MMVVTAQLRIGWPMYTAGAVVEQGTGGMRNTAHMQRQQFRADSDLEMRQIDIYSVAENLEATATKPNKTHQARARDIENYL